MMVINNNRIYESIYAFGDLKFNQLDTKLEPHVSTIAVIELNASVDVRWIQDTTLQCGVWVIIGVNK